MKKKLLLSTLICCLSLSTLGFAEPPHRGPEKDDFPPMHRLEKRLDLNEIQKDQIDAINEKYRDEYKQFAEELKPFHEKIQQLSDADTPDYNEIQSILEKMAPVKIQMHMTRIKHQHEIREVLTDSQRQRLKEIREQDKKAFSKRYRNRK